MSSAASDFESGIMAAVRWLRERGHLHLAQSMIRDIPTDIEGTEDRVTKRIATFVAEHGKDDLATLILEKEWRLK